MIGPGQVLRQATDKINMISYSLTEDYFIQKITILSESYEQLVTVLATFIEDNYAANSCRMRLSTPDHRLIAH